MNNTNRIIRSPLIENPIGLGPTAINAIFESFYIFIFKILNTTN